MANFEDKDSSPDESEQNGDNETPPEHLPSTAPLLDMDNGIGLGLSPGPFYGRHTDNFKAWLRQFDRYCNACRVYSGVRKCEVLPSYLKGNAENVYNTLDQRIRKNYVLLRQRLTELLQPPNMADLASDFLMSRKQRPEEPSADFASDIQRLVNEAYPDLDENNLKKLRLRFFLNGLRPHLQQFVKLTRPTTYEQAVTQARSQEMQDHLLFHTAPWLDAAVHHQPAHQRTPTFRRGPRRNDDPVYFTPKVHHHPKGIRGQHLATTSPQSKPFHRNEYKPQWKKNPEPEEKTTPDWKQMEERICQRIQELCKLQSTPSPPIQPPYRWTETGDPICHLCRKPGHLSRHCPHRQTPVKVKSNLGSSARLHALLTDVNDHLNNATARQLEDETEIEVLREQNARLLQRTSEGMNVALCYLSGYQGPGIARGRPRSRLTPCSWLIVLSLLISLFYTSLSLTVTDHDSLGGELKRFGAIAHPGVGIALVPAGLVVTPEDMRYLPIILHTNISNLNPGYAKNKTCQVYFHIQSAIESIAAEYEGLLNSDMYTVQLKDICARTPTLCLNDTDTHARPKRFLGLLAAGVMGLLGTGLGIANSIYMGKLTSRIDALQSAVAQLEKADEWRTKALQQIEVANEKLYTFVHHSVEQLHDSLVELDCKMELAVGYLQRMVLMHVIRESIRTTVQGITTAATHGELSPLLMSVRQLKQLFSHEADLKNTLFEQEPSLAYQFATMYPIRVDFKRMTFAFLLEVPIVQRTSIAPIYHVNNVGWLSKIERTHYKIDLPSYVIPSHRGYPSYSGLIMDRCKIKPGLWFCEPDAARPLGKSFQKCLGSLADRSIAIREACPVVLIEHQNKTQIVTTPSGVLILTNESYVLVTRTERVVHQVSGEKIPVPRYGVLWLTHDDYTVMTVGDQIITNTLKKVRRITVSTGLDVEIPINFTGIPPIDWTDLDKAEMQNLKAKASIKKAIDSSLNLWNFGWQAGSQIGLLQLIAIVQFVLILTILLIWCWWKRRRKVPWFRRTNLRRTPVRFRNLPEAVAAEERHQLELETLAGPELNVPVETRSRHRGEDGREEPPSGHFFALSPVSLMALIYVEDVQLPVLIDTGAAVTLVTDQLRQQQLQGLSYLPLGEKQRPRINSMTGQPLQMIGMVYPKFAIGQQSLKHSTYVVNTAPYPCIVGLDFLARWKTLGINFERRVLMMNGEMVPMLQSDKELTRYILRTDRNWTIPSRSEAVLLCQLPSIVSNRMSSTADYAFEPDKAFYGNHAIQLARTLVRINQGQIPVRVLNGTLREIKVQKGTLLGYVERLTPSEGVIAILQPRRLRKDSNVVEQLDSSRLSSGIVEAVREAVNQSILTPSEKARLMELLLRYAHVFAGSDSELGRTDLVTQTIDIEDAKPVRQPAYRAPLSKRILIEAQIKDMLAKNVIRESNSPWSSPVVLVTKKDGEERFCVDFRKLNALTKKDVYPLPNLGEALDLIGTKKARYFTTLDLKSGYWQVPLLRDVDENEVADAVRNVEERLSDEGDSDAPSEEFL